MRVKDVDFEANQLVVRAGKGDRDRVTLLPAIGRGALHRQLERVRVHDGDLREEVAGQLFYDDAHVGDQPRGKRGMKAATLWELHPVTHIAFSRGCTQ